MTDAHDAQAEARKEIQLATAEDQQWNREYVKWRSARLDRVQASARVWLGVLTTLLGLLGSVVLVKGGSLVTGVTASGWFQLTLIVLVGLVFGSAVLAVIFGGQATWGGLRDIGQSPDPDSGEDGGRWLRFAEVFGRSDYQEAASGQAPWKAYKTWSLGSADRRRVYLHASRTTGVIAAALIALLAVLAVIAGTVSPVPSVVIVVHNGRLTCGPVSDSAKDTGVSQVVPVPSC
jgi:hypothetical protein